MAVGVILCYPVWRGGHLSVSEASLLHLHADGGCVRSCAGVDGKEVRCGCIRYGSF